MVDRKSISKRLRFEVLKRDKFACVYCGATAAQKLLHCDHVTPVAKGGETTLLNLVAACADCNLGKGATPLSDESAMAKQHRQIAELEERRQQLDMMREWRAELEKHAVTEVDVADEELARRAPEFAANDAGKRDLRKWIKKYGLVEVLASIDESFDHNYTSATSSAWNLAFRRIGRVLAMREQEKIDPHIRKLLYIQGILRNRFDDPDGSYVEPVRNCIEKGYPIDVLEACAKAADGWNHYVDLLNAWSKRKNPPKPPAPSVEKEEEGEPEEDLHLEAESFHAWQDASWALDLWAGCFPNPSCGHILRSLAFDAKTGRRFDDGKITEDDLRLVRGLRAVGLILPIRAREDLFRIDERGNMLWSFRIWPQTPREATNAFNRLGALRLGFWNNPEFFARVDEVH